MSTKSEINKYSSVQKLNKVEFVNKIRAGDSAAFEDLFNSYSQQLINFARHYVFDKQIAENTIAISIEMIGSTLLMRFIRF